MGDRDRGLYEKFIVQRLDGTHDPGEKHYGCRYFVLDLDHDKFAIPALQAYAKHCEKEYPLLAKSLHKLIERAIAEPEEDNE